MKHVRIEDESLINAKPATVWEAIKSTEAHADWHPFVTQIEGSHEQGAVRACTVKIDGKFGHTSETCVADEARRQILWRIDEDSSGFLRMVSDWTAGFSLREGDGGTVVTAQSSFRPRNALYALMMPLIRRKFHTAHGAILAGLRRYAEGSQ